MLETDSIPLIKISVGSDKSLTYMSVSQFDVFSLLITHCAVGEQSKFEQSTLQLYMHSVLLSPES
jgi:hypothetical protein